MSKRRIKVDKESNKSPRYPTTNPMGRRLRDLQKIVPLKYSVQNKNKNA